MTDDTWDVFDVATERGNRRDPVEHDRFDDTAWKKSRREVKPLWELTNRYEMTEDYAADFLSSIYFLLVKADPQVRSRWEMDLTHWPMHFMVQAFSQYPELLALREFTATRPVDAAMAEVSLGSEIAEAFAAMKAARDLAEALAEAFGTAEELAAAAAGGGEAGQAAQAAWEEMMAAAAGLLEQLQVASQGIADEVGPQLQAGMRRATQEAAEAEALRSQFGVEEGLFRRLPFKERQALMQRLSSNRVRAFADMVGALRYTALGTFRRRSVAREEITGVELGQDLSRLASAELVNLAVPALRADFVHRWTQGQALQLRLRGRDKQGRGPIVVVGDESGSMEITDVQGSSREAWAKGFTLGLSAIAREQGRAMLYIGFSSPRQLRLVDLSGGAPEAVLDMVEGHLGGGTHYEGPLSAALNNIELLGVFNRADVVLVTDAQCFVSAAWLTEWHRRRAALDVRCHGVLIGPESPGQLGDICDTVRHLNGVMDPRGVGAGVFKAVL